MIPSIERQALAGDTAPGTRPPRRSRGLMLRTRAGSRCRANFVPRPFLTRSSTIMSAQDSPASSPPPDKRRAILLAIAAILLLVLSAFSVWWFFVGQWRTDTDDAYVGGNIVAVAPQTSGTVTAIYGDTTQVVTEGQLLVQLDDADARLELDAAKADLARAVREVRGLYATSRGNQPLIEQSRADLEKAQAELARSDAALAQAESELRRRQTLVKQNFISAENLQTAETARDAALAQHNAALGEVDAATAAIAHTVDQAGVSNARVDRTELKNHPDVLAAAVRVREAALVLARTRILAPIGGQVARRAVQVGERVKPGDALMALVPLETVWLDANFKETQLPDVRIGQPAEVEIGFLWQQRDFPRPGVGPRTRHGLGIRPAAPTERHRQLGEDRAAPASSHCAGRQRAAATPAAHRAVHVCDHRHA